MADELIIIEEPEQIVEVIDAEAESDKAVVVTPESEIKRFESALSAINSRLTAQEEFNKEVTYTESINTDIAYEKSIPSAARLGFINKIGGMSRKGINLFDFSKPADTLVGITSYAFSDDTLTVVGNDTSAYCRVVWDCTEFVKRLQGKYVNFSADSVTFSNTDAKPTMQFVVSTDDGTKYISILNKYFPTGAKALIPTGNITSAALGVYTHNDNTRLANTITLVNPMLLLDENKGKPYEPYTDSLVTSRVESVSIDDKVVPIQTELRKPMYGVNETLYDYIDVELKKMVKRCGTYTIDDTSTIYSFETLTNAVRMQFRIADAASGYTDCIFSNLDYLRSWDSEVTHGYMYNNTARVIVNGITTREAALAWLHDNPVTIVYALATPTEEDLTAALYLADIAQPHLCNGGKITFDQTQAAKVDIPNEVEYAAKVKQLGYKLITDITLTEETTLVTIPNVNCKNIQIMIVRNGAKTTSISDEIRVNANNTGRIAAKIARGSTATAKVVGKAFFDFESPIRRIEYGAVYSSGGALALNAYYMQGLELENQVNTLYFVATAETFNVGDRFVIYGR